VGGFDAATSFFDITIARFDAPASTRGRRFVYSSPLTASEEMLVHTALFPEAGVYNNNINNGVYYMTDTASQRANDLKKLLRKGVSTKIRVHYGVSKDDIYITSTSRGSIP
jgi:hypothetical protein